MIYPELYNLIKREECERQEKRKSSKDLSDNLLGRVARRQHVGRNKSPVGKDSNQ